MWATKLTVFPKNRSSRVESIPFNPRLAIETCNFAEKWVPTLGNSILIGLFGFTSMSIS